MVPNHGKTFTLKEAFSLIKQQSVTVIFYNMATGPKLNPIHPQLLCGPSVFFQIYKRYQTKKIIPPDNEFGAQVGATQIIQDRQLTLLNTSLQSKISIRD